MKKMISPRTIHGLLLSLCLVLGIGCHDDDNDILVNEWGSSLEIRDDYKISKFTFNKEDAWFLPDSVSMISIGLYSLSDSIEQNFKAKKLPSVELSQYCIMIPKTKVIPDGEYIMRGYNKAGISLGRVFQVYFKNEMLENMKAIAVDYQLSGKGTPAAPYLIQSQKDYDVFKSALAKDSTHAYGIYFKQSCPSLDIRRSPKSDTLNLTFAGCYDGSNNMVKLNFTGPSDHGTGLFSQLNDGASVKNIKLSCYITDAGNHVGAVAGAANGKIFLRNITVSGNIFTNTDNQYGQYIGGLLGDMKDGDLLIQNCIVNGDIQGNNYLGGAVGNFENGKLNIDTLYNNGKRVSGQVKLSGKNYLGYVAGNLSKVQMALRNVTIEHIKSPGVEINNMTCSEKYMGGFVGKAELTGESTIDNCEVIAEMEGNSYIGGLMGALTMREDASLLINSTVVEHLMLKGEAFPQAEQHYIGGFVGKAELYDKSRLTMSDPITCVASAVISGQKYVGGLFGYFEGKLHLNDPVGIHAKVMATEFGAGGICGEMRKTQLEHIEKFVINPLTEVISKNSAGGLIGFAQDVTLKGNLVDGLYFPTIKSHDAFPSHFSGKVTGLNPLEGESIGGMVGAAKYCTFKNICFGGYLEGVNQVGGIAGYAGYVNFDNCVNKSNVIKGHKDRVGGIVGRLTGINRSDGALFNITFRNLLNFAQVDCGGDLAGGIVGYCYASDLAPHDESLVFDRMVNLGNVTASHSAGGCIGYIFDRSRDNVREEWYHPEKLPKVYFQNSANFGDITTIHAGYAGGILAENEYLTTPIFSGCVNRGKITVNINQEDEETWGGGITAYLGEEAAQGATTHPANGHLEECCNFGEIVSRYNSAYLGGLIGEKEEGDGNNPDGWWIIKDSYNRGKITGDYAGSIAGYVDRHNILRHCVDLSNTGNDNEPNDMAGTTKMTNKPDYQQCYILIDKNIRTDVQTTDRTSSAAYRSSGEMKDKSYLDGLDFDQIWVMDGQNDGYPHLRRCLFEFSIPE